MTEQEKDYDDYSKEEQEMIKEIVIARLHALPSNLRLSIG